MLQKVCLRSMIILFWIALISCALYWPKLRLFHFEENSITVFTWGDILDQVVIQEFEKETGIKVYLNYYSSNEELLVKLKATGGEGYDLVIPSDYTVKPLVESGLLQPLDKSKLSFWNTLNPQLLGHPFDPDNTYSIPFSWEIFGLGIDSEFFAHRPFSPSWKLIFDRSFIDYKISMLNDPIDAIQLAVFYLFQLPKETQTLTEEQTAQVFHLLKEQRQWVEAYANFRGDYFLATKNCPVVVASSSYIWKTMRLFPFVQFVLPEEGTFITIENFCIPVASQKTPLVYRFLNHLYRPASVASHYGTFGFFPATRYTFPLPNLDKTAEKLIQSSAEDFQKFHFLQRYLSQQKIRDFWVEVKSVD